MRTSSPRPRNNSPPCWPPRSTRNASPTTRRRKPSSARSARGATRWAIAFLAAGRLSEAEAAFEKYNELTPNLAMLEFNRARVAAQSDKPAEALARLEKAFQSHIAAKGAVPYELLAKLLTKLGKEKELLERLEKLHAAEPTNVPLGRFLADRFRRAGELDKAESLYRGLLSRSRSAAACEGLISLERKRRNADALLAAVGEAIDLPDEASEGVNVEEKAIVADAGLLRELVAAARKQLAAAPDKLDYRQRLAVALLALDAKQDDLAGEFFDLAIKVRPERTATLLKIWDGDCSRKTASRKPHACSNGESTRNRRRKTASFSTSTFPSRWRRRADRRGPGGRPQGRGVGQRHAPVLHSSGVDSLPGQALRRGDRRLRRRAGEV